MIKKVEPWLIQDYHDSDSDEQKGINHGAEMWRGYKVNRWKEDVDFDNYQGGKKKDEDEDKDDRILM